MDGMVCVFVCVVCHGWSTFDYVVQGREGDELHLAEEGNVDNKEPKVKWRHVSRKIMDLVRDAWVGGQTDRQTDGRMNGCIDGQMDRQTLRQINC